MPMQRFEARPTLEKDGSVTWELCHMNPTPDVCGKSKDTYPDVDLGKGSGAHTFKFAITNDKTGLGIKFSDDPLWIGRGTQPSGPGIDPQIETPAGNGTPVLTFVDKNSLPDALHPAPVVLKYQLNFVDKDNKKVTEIDPEITNGGTNAMSDPMVIALLTGMAVLLLVAVLWFRGAAGRRQAAVPPASDSSALRNQDLNDIGGGRP